jgi:hypothetical protein
MPSSWAACSGDRISIATFYNNFPVNNILIDKDILRDYNTGDGGPIAGLTQAIGQKQESPDLLFCR